MPTKRIQLICQTILKQCANEYNEGHAKLNERLYLHNALAYSDQTWCML